MGKAVTPADDYKYDLPDELKKVAETELRESYETIQQSVKALREWAEKNPRISKIRMGKFKKSFRLFKIKYLKFGMCILANKLIGINMHI